MTTCRRSVASIDDVHVYACADKYIYTQRHMGATSQSEPYVAMNDKAFTFRDLDSLCKNLKPVFHPQQLENTFNVCN